MLINYTALSRLRLAFPSLATSLVAVVALAASLASAQVPNPTVTGPIAQPVAPGDPSHNYIFFTSNHDLAGHGYVEEEFFIQGTANRYNTPNQTNPDASSTGTIISSGNPY